MVVVQYDTRGFLRGGTDDEYPIQAFANRGYAVLSFKRPQSVSSKTAKDFEQLGRLDLEQFADRRNVQSSLEAAIKLVIDRGIADPARIGITGLSDGSTTVEWELIHSKLFAAAAMSSCCFDTTLVSDVGPSASRHFMAEGYPGVLERNDPFWKDVALEVNARRVSTPILMNASEEEFSGALLTYTALREAGVAVDLFEYPGEFHARWQPAHRLATYRRSLDWFDYWLRNVRSDAPDRQSELKEWDRLRREAGQGQPDLTASVRGSGAIARDRQCGIQDFDIDQLENAHPLEIGNRALPREDGIERILVDDACRGEAAAEQSVADGGAEIVEQLRREPAGSSLDAGVKHGRR